MLLGMILAQVQDRKERVISYGGRKLNNAEQRYSTTERECLGVIVGLKHFQHYLRGVSVTIITDHAALKWLLSQKKPKGKLARWVAFIQQFHYTIRHQPGKNIGHVDGLSRRDYDENESENFDEQLDNIILPGSHLEKVNVSPIVFKGRRTRLKGHKVKCDTPPVLNLPVVEWSPDKIRDCQLRDPEAGLLLKYLEDKILPQDDTKARQTVLASDMYLVHDRVLYHLLDTKIQDAKRHIEEIRVSLVVSQELKYDVLTSVHGDLHSGHYGMQRTYSTLRLKYFWKGMYKDCRNFILSCQQCNTRKNPVSPIKAPLQPMKPARINERWAMDIVHMPLTPRGNKYILTFTEYCSRYVEAFPLQNTQAATVAKILVQEICFRFGSQELLSDLGSNFISELVQHTCKLLGIRQIYTTPYHPQTNGLIEKFHSTLAKNLSMYVSADHRDWDLYVCAVCYGYNTSVCIDSTQYSPFFIMFGREPYYPLDTVLPKLSEIPPNVREHALQVAHAREVSMSNIKECQHIIKKKYDKNAIADPLQPGELVWIFFPEINVGGSPKFFHNWSGPYLLTEKISPTDFKVSQAHDHKPLKNPIHVNRMKRFHHRSVVPPTPDNLHQIQQAPHEVSDLHMHDQAALLQSPPQQTNQANQQLQSLSQTLSRTSTVPQVQTVLENHSPMVDIDLPDPEVPRPENKNIETLSETQYEINKLLRARYNKDGKLEYLIDWKGYPASARTYEPLENLNQAATQYIRTHKIPITGHKRA